jgi:hypothetical protein
MMATKAKKQPSAPKPRAYPRKEIPYHCDNQNDDDAVGQAFAKVLTSPAVAAHRVIQAANPQNLRDEIDAPGMLAMLEQQAAAVNRGDMTQAEAMLMNQATALQSLFTRMTELGLAQSTMPNLDGFMRLALRAQSQCRATLETLATIKNPPIVYARQANVTTGPQQVNNGIPARNRAREIETEQSQLSGGTHELLPDTRTSGNASQVNTTLETLGEIDRAEVPRG